MKVQFLELLDKRFKLINNRWHGLYMCKRCGNTHTAVVTKVTCNVIISCGCYRRDMWHLGGKSLSPEYNVWRNMLKRCDQTNALNNSSHKDYAGRGIAVDPVWLDFNQFYADMGPRPGANFEIDRRDNNGPYCKENCRWVTKTENGNNKRNNILIILEGETKTLSEWCRYYNMSYLLVYKRYRRNWPVTKLFNK